MNPATEELGRAADRMLDAATAAERYGRKYPTAERDDPVPFVLAAASIFVVLERGDTETIAAVVDKAGRMVAAVRRAVEDEEDGIGGDS